MVHDIMYSNNTYFTERDLKAETYISKRSKTVNFKPLFMECRILKL